MELTQAQSNWLENIWSQERPMGIGEFLFRYVITPIDELTIASLMLWHLSDPTGTPMVNSIMNVALTVYMVYMVFGVVMCLVNWLVIHIARTVPSLNEAFVTILDKTWLSRRNYEMMVSGPPYLDIVRYFGFFFFLTMLYVYMKPVYLLITLIFWLTAIITRHKSNQYARERLEEING